MIFECQKLLDWEPVHSNLSEILGDYMAGEPDKMVFRKLFMLSVLLDLRNFTSFGTHVSWIGWFILDGQEFNAILHTFLIN